MFHDVAQWIDDFLNSEWLASVTAGGYILVAGIVVVVWLVVATILPSGD